MNDTSAGLGPVHAILRESLGQTREDPTSPAGGAPACCGLETSEDALGITAFLGKVMPNKDVHALGTQYILEGEDDNKTFLLLSWKRLF